MSNDEQPLEGTTASIHVTGSDAEGNPTTSDGVLDTETGQTVMTGDALSADAQAFMDMLGGVAGMIAQDDEVDGSE